MRIKLAREHGWVSVNQQGPITIVNQLHIAGSAPMQPLLFNSTTSQLYIASPELHWYMYVEKRPRWLRAVENFIDRRAGVNGPETYKRRVVIDFKPTIRKACL